MPNAQNVQRSAKAGGFRITSFPKEFERNFWETFDRRYYLILLLSFLVVYGTVIMLANKKYSKEQLESQIRQKYIQKFYEAEIVAETPQVTEEGGGGMEEQPVEEEVKDQRAQKDIGKRAEVKGQSAAERRARARARAAARARARASMEQAVAGTGVLAELAAGGGGGTGEAVYDVLGSEGAGGFGDLDQVLKNVGGLETASSSARRSQLGARKMGGGTGAGDASIDELIEGGIGPTGSESIARRGNFSVKFAKGTVSGKASKSTARSVDAIGRVINKHTDAIMECYRKEARLNPNLKGSLTVIFTIRYNGRVSNVRITNSTLRNKKVESCVKRRIRSWRFQPIDRKEGNVTFRQKYIFTS
ncbi:MAG TPA: TonB family protein [Caldithrix abyssi]|uniref:TonB family protein n=1 Tax=Caldithrix abyssi TaxID=187145 RepID=A0A7V5PPG8_CALAY|nr:TonB family protein [Caldithrix abyssi]